jgi:hypothetical protein
MKITYEFVTGEVSEVEVDERLRGMLLDLDRQQENNEPCGAGTERSGCRCA